LIFTPLLCGVLPGLVGGGALFKLLVHGVDVPGNQEYGNEDEDEAQRPGDEADGKDGGAHGEFVGDDAGDERGGG